MNYIDLVSLLRKFSKNGLEKCVMYGKIQKEVKRPDNIYDTVIVDSSCRFVEVQAFAVNLGAYTSYLKEHGIYNKTGIYMVNGSFITLVDNDISVGDWYEFRGTLRFGTKDLNRTYVGMLTYYKDKADWHIRPTSCSDLESCIFDGEVSDYFEESVGRGYVILPDLASSMPRFTATLDKSVYRIDVKEDTGIIKYFNKESRNTCLPESDMLKKFRDKLIQAEKSREAFVKSLFMDYRDCRIDDIKYLCKKIIEYKTRKPAESAYTGRAVLKNYLSNFRGSSKKYLGDVTISEYLISIFDEVYEYMFDHNAHVPAEGDAWDLCKSAFGDLEKFYTGVVSDLTGVSYDLMETAYNQCVKYGLSMSNILYENPYLLQFICGMGFKDIEKLAICFGRHNEQDLVKYRNIAMLNDFINDESDGSTVFNRNKIYNSKMGIVLTKSKYNIMINYNCAVSFSVKENVWAYLIRNNAASWGYLPNGFVELDRGNMIRRLTMNDLVIALKNYGTTGMGVVLDDYITSSTLIRKELYVIDTMRKMGSTVNDYPKSEIDKYIAEYESDIGFELEPEQRNAVHLVVNNGFLVSGIAGSGKTTVSKCILYVIEKLEPTMNVKFAAPTGRASKRMQEVVKRPVKTMHSEFKIGMRIEDSISCIDESVDIGNTAYFFDEGAMVTLDLMYQVLRHIDPETSRVYIFGDFCQLSPIGKGLPFKDLLRFMPCVFLNVSKRAAEGSESVRNCSYINNNSDTSNWKQLESGGNFNLISCINEQIQGNVYDLCAHYLGKKHMDGLPEVNVSADDIQVVTPLSKESYNWGTVSLNKVLQPLFNPNRGYSSSFVYKLTDKMDGYKFSIGDRVIHTAKNMYSMQWYVAEDDVFRKVYGYGICNGEVGKVLGFMEADSVTILDESEDEPNDFMYPDFLRDDTTWFGDNKYFVAVQYYDYMNSRNIVILYRAELNTMVTSNEGIALKGEDLTRLSLFYAGTTHKLQGSEAKVVICPLGNVSYSGFITREMLYTMFTRGKLLVFGVGSVDNGMASMLSKARKDLKSKDITTIGEVVS